MLGPGPFRLSTNQRFECIHVGIACVRVREASCARAALECVRPPPKQGRLGGSALAHVFGQLGDAAPDLDPADGLAQLAQLFHAVQVRTEKKAPNQDP